MSSKPIEVDYVRPFLFPYQKKILDAPERFSVVEGATKVGKTSPLIVWLFEEALKGVEGDNFWWVAPIYSQAEIAFNRMQRFCKIERGGKGKPFLTANIAKLRLTTPSGAVIHFKSADNPNSLYGEDVKAFVFDEASRSTEDAWTAILSTLTNTGGRGKFIANVVGRNWYWKLAEMAKEGKDPDFKHYKINCWDAVCTGNLSLEEVIAAKKVLKKHGVYKKLYAYANYRSQYPTTDPTRLKLSIILKAEKITAPEIFKQLFEAEPSEDGSNPFGQKNIELATKGLSNLAPLCFGIDLASTVDYTVVIGLDIYCQVCYIQRYQVDWPLTKQILSVIPDLRIGIDSTGVGGPVVADLKEGRENMEAVIFTPARKQELMRSLATAFYLHQVTIPDHEVLQEELNSFEFFFSNKGNIRYSAPAGKHDDTVMALALAVEQWNKLPKYATGPARASGVELQNSSDW